MSESKPFINSIRTTWLDGGKDSWKEIQKSDFGKSEGKPFVSTSRTSWLDGRKDSGRYSGKETQKSEFGRSWSTVSMQAKLVSRRIWNKLFHTAAQLKCRGDSYNISIDCDTREWKMVIKVENRVAVNVDHLVWNFRGIKKFSADSGSDPLEFEVIWDVEDWLFDKPILGDAIFIFRNVNPSSPSQATIADFTASTDIRGDLLVVYAWKEEDQIE